MSERANRRPSSPKVDYVEVHIRVPKPVMAFLEAFADFCGFDMEHFWKHEVELAVASILDDPTSNYWDKEAIRKRHGLDKALGDC